MLIPRVVPSASTSYTLESSGSRDRAPKPSTLLCHEPCIGVLACCPDTTFCIIIVVVASNKQQIAEGCWLVGSRTVRQGLELVVEFAIGLVLELDATKRGRKLDVVTEKTAWIVETCNSADSVETNVRYGITLENPGGRRAKTKEPGGSEWSRVDRAICVDRMRSYGRIRVLTSSLVLARSSREWNKIMAILMMVALWASRDIAALIARAKESRS
ncbi:hypothetical protein ALC56_04300 [Trachymyrmex septentrionalis]|uniref:Uncharacterized protein n=1 Tax=Trachymyrmex septentrionalis TaxID=34720 RepID=A0A195FMH4_9HYME|nr:hypothetical protein ALC56_04300 [Trachymyrmex septentrionalis]